MQLGKTGRKVRIGQRCFGHVKVENQAIVDGNWRRSFQVFSTALSHSATPSRSKLATISALVWVLRDRSVA